MGVRINKRIGGGVSASFPLGGLIVGGFVAVALLCGLIGLAMRRPEVWIAIGLFVFVIAPGIVLLERHNRRRR